VLEGRGLASASTLRRIVLGRGDQRDREEVQYREGATEERLRAGIKPKKKQRDDQRGGFRENLKLSAF